LPKSSDHKRIINDPVYGFITIQDNLIYELINHKSFQRLRRIKQLGLTDFVYPSAVHTRFHHALGSMHLMNLVLSDLESRNVRISTEEYQAALIAILLHDIGHGPLSHTLENSLLKNVDHEDLSLLVMKKMNDEFNGKLDLAIEIFCGKYNRPFFHQLVSGQLDLDRMDYLKRDSFYTGVSEGNIGISRLLQMLNVVSDELVIDEKGVHNIESFLIARRFMYWQVYLHKTTVAAEKMMASILLRATELTIKGELEVIPSNLRPFIERKISLEDFDDRIVESFLAIDDTDIWSALKSWTNSNDKTLSFLSNSVIDRNLFRLEFSPEAWPEKQINLIKDKISDTYQLKSELVDYYFSSGILYNALYARDNAAIKIQTSRGILPLEEVSDLPHLNELGKIVKKYYLCYPKNVSL